MQHTPNTYMGHKIIIDEQCDVYNDVPIRPHRKKRLRKKFLKKYGTRKVLVATDAYMTKGGAIIMSPHMYNELCKYTTLANPTGGLF